MLMLMFLDFCSCGVIYDKMVRGYVGGVVDWYIPDIIVVAVQVGGGG